MNKYIELINLTSQYGQAHLLKFWDFLDEEGKNRLYESIKSVDFKKSFAPHYNN